MRIAYFDCFSGISGDMTLGALVDVGVDLAILQAELAKLPVTGYRLETRVVKRGGLRGTKVDVLVEAAQPARKYTDIVAMISQSDLSPSYGKMPWTSFVVSVKPRRICTMNRSTTCTSMKWVRWIRSWTS